MKLANIPGLNLLGRIVGYTMLAVKLFTWKEEPLRENLRLLLAKATQDLLAKATQALVEAQPKPGSTDPLANDLKEATDLLDQARKWAEFSDALFFSPMRIELRLRAKDLAAKSEALSTMIWSKRRSNGSKTRTITRSVHLCSRAPNLDAWCSTWEDVTLEVPAELSEYEGLKLWWDEALKIGERKSADWIWASLSKEERGTETHEVWKRLPDYIERTGSLGRRLR